LARGFFFVAKACAVRSSGMRATLKKHRSTGLWLLGVVLAVAVAMLLVPGAAAGAGRLVGGLWVSTMGAVFGLIGGLFGG
jgi:hypothetical protein